MESDYRVTRNAPSPIIVQACTAIYIYIYTEMKGRILKYP